MKLILMLILFLKTNSADTDEIFDQLIEKYEDLKNSNFLLKGVESITYSFIKIIIKFTFAESPDWIRNKKCTINPQNKDNKCFQYSVIVSMHHKEAIINNLNWENISFHQKNKITEILK